MNDFDVPQPRGQAEIANVASEAMGMKGGKLHSPKFHRMSISAAENGYSVDHTIESEPSDNDRNRNSSDPMAGQGPHHTTKTHLVTTGHPAYHHIQAIHDSLGTKPSGRVTPLHATGPQNR